MKQTITARIFSIFNYTFLFILAMTCVLPFVHLIAISLSQNSAVSANIVRFWPVHFTSYAYEYVIARPAFWRAFLISIQRVLLGGFINMFLVIITAYPLSKEMKMFKHRTIYVWFFFITMLFSGGLIPMYMLLLQLNMLNTIWALTLPYAVPVFNLILMLNFFRQLPVELEEAALLDGANHFSILWKIYVPCSLPAIATIALLTIVFHWNSWFDGLIFMNRPEMYPLQSFLQTVIIGMNTRMTTSATADYQRLLLLSDRTVRAAQIIIAVIPVLIVYPFLQKYFVSGIVLGSVKG